MLQHDKGDHCLEHGNLDELTFLCPFTLNGSTDWPDRNALVRLGQTRCDLSVQTINPIIAQAADVLAKLAPEVAKYFNENSVHREIGGRLLAAWQTGIR